MGEVHRGRHRQRGRHVVGVAVLEDLEALVAQPWRQVVVDVEQVLQRAVGAVAVVHEPVHVPLLRGRLAGQRPPAHEDGWGSGHCLVDLVGHDRHERYADEQRPDGEQRAVDPQHALEREPPGGQEREPHDEDPEPDEHLGREAGQLEHVAVHQDAEDGRRHDQRRARAHPEHDREPEGDERGEADHEHERLGDVLGRHLAEVLRPQEEDRVGREEQRMDPSQPARPRHAPGDAAKRVQLGASWSTRKRPTDRSAASRDDKRRERFGPAAHGVGRQSLGLRPCHRT